MELTKTMKPHQIEAYEKLKSLKVGALYMSMGTGKTLVALSLIKQKLDKGRIDKVLWLCPCSIKADLASNIADSCADPPEIKIMGLESLSQSSRVYYEALEYLSNGKVMMIVDESNMIKNFFAVRTKRTATLGKLCPYRYILNGTPISKNEADLFAQWYFLDARILGYNSFYSFAANHIEYDVRYKSKPVRMLNTDYLSRKIEPYTFSFEKDDTLQLPDKHYHVVHFGITEKQEWEYRAAMDEILFLDEEMNDIEIYKLFTALQRVTSGNRITEYEHLKSERMFDDPIDNPRIKCLLDTVAKTDGDKCIVWCKFHEEIDDVKQVLSNLGDVAELHGRISQKRRIQELERFKGGARFLVANKNCGGYGLNLQHCHNMIYYNNDFNWATKAQSENRIHRFGQFKDCHIYDIVATSSIDERIYDNLTKKENLVQSFRRALEKNRDFIKEWIGGKS